MTTPLQKPSPKFNNLVRMACFVSNHVSWNTSWETLIYAMIDWPQIFCKGVSTVLGSLSALDTRDHTRSDWSSVFKTASRDSSELFREDMLKYFLSSLHRQKHNSERHKVYIFFLYYNGIKLFERQNRMTIHRLCSMLPSHPLPPLLRWQETFRLTDVHLSSPSRNRRGIF